MNTRSHGFLFIQVGVVLSLVLIILLLAIPQFSFLQKRLLSVELEKLYSILVYLQHKAVAQHKDITLTFDIARNTYQADNLKGALAQGVTFGFLPNTFGPPSGPTRKVYNAITFTNNQVIFHKNGTIQAGTIYVIDKAKRLMGALTVPVSHISYLRKYTYHHNKWNLSS